MKRNPTIKKIAQLIASFTLTLSIAPLITSANAGPDHEHNHSEGIQIPDTRDALWTAIQTQHSALLQAVESKDDAAVHKVEGELQAYLKALPEKVSDLEEGTRRRIEGQTHNLARAYDAVHHAADDKSWDKATSEMKKADGGMKLLSALMPK